MANEKKPQSSGHKNNQTRKANPSKGPLLRGRREGPRPEQKHDAAFYKINSTTTEGGVEFAKANSQGLNPQKGQRPGNKNFKRRKSNKQNRRQNSEFQERVLDIARVTTVVKGGRRFSFSAFVIIGDKKGRVGFGHGKANEVPDAIKKAIRNAQNQLVTVPIYNASTVPHESQGKFLASKVLIKPAPKGKGVIASGTMRAVLELAGYNDVYAKSYGSRNKMNTTKATFVALGKLRTAETIADLRGIPVSHFK